MGRMSRLTATLLGGVAYGVLIATPVSAQSADTNLRHVSLLERLVIGAGAEKVAIDTPQAVTVVTQEDIDAKQASTTGEILKETPGIALTGSQRLLGEGFNIRGIGSAETSGDEARIIITVDGAKKFYEQYRMGSFFSDPELYKQVEVLRGPASSTLYGAGAFGGVINFTTKDASDFIEEGKTGAVRLKGSYSSNGNGLLASGILAQRINDTFEVLAAGNFRQSDLQTLANGGTLTGSDFQAWSGLLKGTIYLDGEQVVRISHQRWDSDADNQYYAQTGTADFGTVDRHVVDATTVVSYENPDEANDMLDLKVQLSYSDTAVEQDNATSPNASLSNIFNADYGYKTWQLNAQNASTFTGEGWENVLTYGVQLSNQDRVAVPETGTVITTHPEGTSTGLGVFAQSEHTINEQLTLIGGARVDFRHLDPSDALTVSTPSDDVAFSPKLAALYRFNENFNVFGSLAHTERMPTLDEMFQYSGSGQTARTPNLDLQKEYSNNVEAGFGLSGYDLLQDGDSAGVKVTGFVNDITDGIRSNPISSGAPYFVNIAGMRLWGLEVEGSYDAEMMFARLALTVTRGENTETFIGSNPSNTRYAGDPLDTLPQDRVALTLGGRLPEQNIEYGGTVTVAAAPISQITSAQGTSESWATLDLFASWKPEEGPLKGLEAQFGIDNVFDTDYRENLSLDRSTGRTFKVTLAKQFDY